MHSRAAKRKPLVSWLCTLSVATLLISGVVAGEAAAQMRGTPSTPTDIIGAGPSDAVEAGALGNGWPIDYTPAVPMVTLPSTTQTFDAPPAYPVVTLPPLDTAALLDEDAVSEGWDNPPRVGVNRELPLQMPGNWALTADGGHLWTLAITSPSAKQLRLHFDAFSLPAGAELYAFSPKYPDQVVGPYLDSGPHGTGAFWTGTIQGETAYIEYYVPAGLAAEVPFDIDELAHMYRVLSLPNDLRAPLDCMGDVACYSAWEDVSYSVAKITFEDDGGGWYNCSGTLLAAQNNDQTPYFLTAAHCIDTNSEAQTMEAEWFYQNATCGGSLMTSRYSSNASLLGTSGEGGSADWTLLMINGVLPAGVYWSGWTSSDPASGTWSVGVHHPSGSWKRYSRGRRQYGYSDFHRIQWDVSGAVGTIYYGSSGSGIFREDNQQLFGICSFGYGEAGCDNLNVDIYYGKFSYVYSSMSSYLAAGPDDGYENNDSCAGAATLGEGSYSNLVVKSVDEDWYRIYLANEDQVEIQLSFTDGYGNINAELYDSCGGSVVASGTTTTSNEVLYHTNFGSGAYFYLRVFLADDTRNEYDLDITIGTFADTDPPTPNPMTFASPPVPLTDSSITMTATTATDLITPPVSYYFESPDGHSSAWQSGTAYVDNGLAANTRYQYRVKARDNADPPNETATSTWYTPATDIETPDVTIGTVTTSSIALSTTQSMSNLTEGYSGVYFDSETTGGDGGLNEWIQVETDTAASLAVNTSYTFRAKGRNQSSFETDWGASATKATLALAPISPTIANVGVSTLDVNVRPNSNPAYTEFAIECLTSDGAWNGRFVSASGTASVSPVWQTDAAWGTITVQGLDADTEYCFHVKARNVDNVETAYSGQNCATTGKDCNGNDVPDADDISGGFSQDCNGNSIPDECDIADCDPNDPACQDCNTNGVPDECDISGGTSTDNNLNGIPDECESGEYELGDMNCDGLINNGDIDPFVLALTEPGDYAATYPECDINLADVNGDSLVNNGDIDAFVALLSK